MMSLRLDRSVLGQWWYTVDRWSMAAIFLLIGIGAILALAATPAIATRLNLDPFFFVRRQFTLLPVAALVMVMVSMLPARAIRILAMLGLLGSMTMLVGVIFMGAEIKGARRWVNVGGFSLQPSEFAKPCFAVLAAWLFARQRRHEGFPGDVIAIAICAALVGLILAQPDVGMVAVLLVVFLAQYVLAGLRMMWVAMAGSGLVAALAGAYYVFPHVASRINRFLDPNSGDNFQVSRAEAAFQNGGFLGRGPGEGTVKLSLPDAHSDFIFAVAGEEFGLVLCLVILLLFAFVVLRGMARMMRQNDLFVLIACTGILVQFGLQALINVGSTLHVLPTKGMTLPFISYGGSSLLAISLGMGMLLGLGRARIGGGEVG